MLNWPNKDPDEVADYEIVWTERLDGDTIASSTWILPPGLTKDSDSHVGDTTTIWLSGGVDGAVYKLVNRVVTVGGRTFEEKVQIAVQSVDGGLVTLRQAKRHLRVHHDDDDDTISLYLGAAIASVQEYVDRIVYAVGGIPPSDDDGTAIEVTPAITAAILLLLGDLYENREADSQDTSSAMLPRAVRALLAPYRVWRTTVEDE